MQNALQCQREFFLALKVFKINVMQGRMVFSSPVPKKIVTAP